MTIKGPKKGSTSREFANSIVTLGHPCRRLPEWVPARDKRATMCANDTRGFGIRSRTRASSGQSLTDTTHLRPSYRSAAGGFTRPPPSASSTTLFPPSLCPPPSISPSLPLALNRITLCRPLSLSLPPTLGTQVLARRKGEPACRAPRHENEFLVHHLSSFASYSTSTTTSLFHLVLGTREPAPSQPVSIAPLVTYGFAKGREKGDGMAQREKESQ